MYVENRTKIANFPTPRVFNAPDVLIQYRSVTDTQPPSHVAVAITLNAKASSLKTNQTEIMKHVNCMQHVTLVYNKQRL